MERDYKQEIRTFVKDNFFFEDSDERFQEDTSFIENGIVDSLGMLELVEFIESTYHIRVEDDEFIPDNLDSLNKLATFLDRKSNPRSA